jgi:hypothetical protein
MPAAGARSIPPQDINDPNIGASAGGGYQGTCYPAHRQAAVGRHGFSAFPAIDLWAVLRLIHNQACKVRLVRVVAPCSADRTLAHQLSQGHGTGASAAWHYTLDMNSLSASLSLP